MIHIPLREDRRPAPMWQAIGILAVGQWALAAVVAFGLLLRELWWLLN